ncbi:hypothetical protein Scep_028625 [Stephania cephalantha]|uniref:Receptor-like serine/threonine-protein kinase n=1 Tax=Stephania cephalantha TaxID=152367 RepID=A0AAP0EHL7_9MAGN
MVLLLSIALLVLYSFFNNNLCYSTDDTITHNRFLRDGDTIVSNGGIYALGFFSPGNSQKRYVGIWFNKVPEQTVVWVANRADPINSSSSSGLLKMDNRANLVIFNGNQTNPVWSNNISVPTTEKTNSSSLFYKLLDSGNLVLVEENRGNRGAVFLWQSFDYPTNTHLPGMKLGLNLKSGTNWSLTSWKTREDPSNGDYVCGMDRTKPPELYTKRGSKLIWRTGPWNGQAWNGVPEMMGMFILNYTVVSNPDEVYFMFDVHNASIFTRVVLDELGVTQRFTWVEDTKKWNNFWSGPGDSCDDYGKCGSFGSCNSNNALICSCLPGFKPKSERDWYLKDGSQGCVRKREVLCGKGDGFLELEKVKLPDTLNARVDMSLGIEDCGIACRNNCSCTGYASAYVNGSGCLAWFGDLVDMREYTDGGQDFFVRVDAIELENSKRGSRGSSSNKKKVVLLCVLIVGGLLIFISAFYCWFKKGKRRGLAQREGLRRLLTFNLSTNLEETSEETNAKFELPTFDLNTVMVATENFSLQNELGSGGFGCVYKGKLPDGREIAVKRLSKNSGQGVKEFKNEVVLIAKLQHRNLVQILGFCVEEEEKMLIYEYMPNKSLNFLLFDQTRSRSLDWRMRKDIILGIARGVLYLHQDSRLRIVHRDLKASNILLDAEMNPKISDFGMARIFGGNQTQGNTNRVVGTFGYMSPEYAMDGLFSTKSDVFSFGVLLLEIICGKKNSGFFCEDPSMNLIQHVWELWEDGRPLELVDPSMGDSFSDQEVTKFIQVGILCVQENANDRPTMSSVVFMLGNETTIPTPRQPAFIVTYNLNLPEYSTTRTGSCSVNEMSTTIVECR